ncbi:MAG: TFIIB-type zinc ribbon-containing protein [Eubacteriales bacterium]|nr:TFIIB-type zinc ribbon-containing protein [Clostridiales bacterium]MDY5836901.1 TFIIB-type zinc ribbon-containing protein [Eubacteriales bacterium]
MEDWNAANPVDPTASGLKDGQVKCPKCGSTDIATNTKTGKLRCNFCRHEFELELAAADADISTLRGTVFKSGAEDIADNAEDLITLKCESCGAEVVIDTNTSTQARCHWCRNTLSLNNQIPNGAVPDVILPFKVSKADAQAKISKFVQDRKFFAHPQFTREFSCDNICGVYIPYMLVDINGHMRLAGKGEIQTACREVGEGKDKHYEYDADVYQVGREFDIYIDDFSIESSSDKLDYSSKVKTTNIINAIMPFDTENCVRFNANYLTGYTSEKRDTNIKLLKQAVDAQSSDVARLAITDTLDQYDRGVHWEEEDYQVVGDAWKAAYLPVWLYSYMQTKGDKHLLHYVAVNARSQETMGSVPINFTKLFFCSLLVELFSGLLAFAANLYASLDKFNDTAFQNNRSLFWLLLVSGFVFYYTIYLRYRNSNQIHHYEVESKHEIANLFMQDDFITSKTGLSNAKIWNDNTADLKGQRLDLLQDEKLKKANDRGVLDEAIQNQQRLEERDKDQEQNKTQS